MNMNKPAQSLQLLHTSAQGRKLMAIKINSLMSEKYTIHTKAVHEYKLSSSVIQQVHTFHIQTLIF